MQKCGITHQTAIQQEIEKKDDIAVEGAGLTQLAKRGCNRRGAQGLKDLMSRRLDSNEDSHQVMTTKLK